MHALNVFLSEGTKMAAYTIAQTFTTISILTTGDTVTTRGRYVKVKNFSTSSVVSYSEAASPAGPITAGNQSSIQAAPATGVPDATQLRPNTLYNFRAGTATSLCGFEEIDQQPLG